MPQAPPEPTESRRYPADDHDPPAHDPPHPFREVVETTAAMYFSACRKLARAINRLKGN